MGEENDTSEHPERKSSPQPHPKNLKVLTTAAIYSGNVSLVVVLAALAASAFSLYMIPHCPTQLAFFIVVGVLGFSSGLYDALQVVWIIEIWQDKSGPFILAQHLCFAVGCNVPSILIAPFLTSNERESQIYIPFTIMGAITSVALLFQMLLFTFYRYYTPPMYASENSNELTENSLEMHQQEPSERNRIASVKTPSQLILGIDRRKLQLITITGMFLGAYQGMEVCTMEFIPIFGQYSKLQMTESASTYVLTSLTGMFAIGRAIGVILIFKVRGEAILSINCTLIAIANLILLVWANDNLTMFWIGSIAPDTRLCNL